MKIDRFYWWNTMILLMSVKCYSFYFLHICLSQSINELKVPQFYRTAPEIKETDFFNISVNIIYCHKVSSTSGQVFDIRGDR